MNKAFIFDMDGVIVNSEIMWLKYENSFLEKTLGKEIVSKIGDTIGISVKSVYERAREFGFSMPYETLQKLYDEAAIHVYDHAAITPGVEDLASFLISHEFKIGIVSSSNLSWIQKVIPRLSFKNDISDILSLNARDDLRHKPYPDGYLEMMKLLHCQPAQTAILEDSNRGISAAKTSGAFTITYTQNLVPGYNQISADAKADTMNEVITILQTHFNLN